MAYRNIYIIASSLSFLSEGETVEWNRMKNLSICWKWFFWWDFTKKETFNLTHNSGPCWSVLFIIFSWWDCFPEVLPQDHRSLRQNTGSAKELLQMDHSNTYPASELSLKAHLYPVNICIFKYNRGVFSSKRCVHKAIIAEHSTLICSIKSKPTSYWETETSSSLLHKLRGISCIQFALLTKVIEPINPGTSTSMNQKQALLLHVATAWMFFKLTSKSQKCPVLNLVSRIQLCERLEVVFK